MKNQISREEIRSAIEDKLCAQSYLRFVLIHLCRIDMSESCLQSQAYILPSRLSP